MTAYAFVDGSTATEITEGSSYASPITGTLFPAGWHLAVTQAEREAESIYPIVEPSAVTFPNEVTSTSLVVTAGPTVTRTNTTATMSYDDQRDYLHALIDELEAAKFETSFLGNDGAGGFVSYPLSQTLRDSVALWGQVAHQAMQGRRATGNIDWNASDQPADGAEIYINGVTFTFVSGAPGANEIQIGATSADTVTAAAAVLNASTDPAVSEAAYALQGFNALLVVHKVFGTAGNAFTLGVGTSPSPNAVASGATLSGGIDPWEQGRTEWHHPDGFPHEFGLTDVNGNKVPLDAYDAFDVTRNLAYFTDFVSSYARDQKLAATTAASGSDQAALQDIYDEVNDPTNWDPGTPPTWP